MNFVARKIIGIGQRRRDPARLASTSCVLCGLGQRERGNDDHLVIETPDVGRRAEMVCGPCGGTLARVIEKFGSHLTFQIEEAQVEAGERDTWRRVQAISSPSTRRSGHVHAQASPDFCGRER